MRAPNWVMTAVGAIEVSHRLASYRQKGMLISTARCCAAVKVQLPSTGLDIKQPACLEPSQDHALMAAPWSEA